MNFQNTIKKLQSVRSKAAVVDRNTVSFYQQWQKGVTMAMRGNLEVDLREHSSAYIEGLLDAVFFLEMEYFNRICNGLPQNESIL